MAIPAVNATYIGNGPVDSGQVFANELSGPQAQELTCFGTAVLDGSLTSFAFNFIDGTKTLSFTPSGCLVSVCGGTQGAAAPVSVVADAPTATAVTIRLSGAGTNANTLKVMVKVIK